MQSLPSALSVERRGTACPQRMRTRTEADHLAQDRLFPRRTHGPRLHRESQATARLVHHRPGRGLNAGSGRRSHTLLTVEHHLACPLVVRLAIWRAPHRINVDDDAGALVTG